MDFFRVDLSRPFQIRFEGESVSDIIAFRRALAEIIATDYPRSSTPALDPSRVNPYLSSAGGGSGAGSAVTSALTSKVALSASTKFGKRVRGGEDELKTEGMQHLSIYSLFTEDQISRINHGNGFCRFNDFYLSVLGNNETNQIQIKNFITRFILFCVEKKNEHPERKMSQKYFEYEFCNSEVEGEFRVPTIFKIVSCNMRAFQEIYNNAKDPLVTNITELCKKLDETSKSTANFFYYKIFDEDFSFFKPSLGKDKICFDLSGLGSISSQEVRKDFNELYAHLKIDESMIKKSDFDATFLDTHSFDTVSFKLLFKHYEDKLLDKVKGKEKLKNFFSYGILFFYHEKTSAEEKGKRVTVESICRSIRSSCNDVDLLKLFLSSAGFLVKEFLEIYKEYKGEKPLNSKDSIEKFNNRIHEVAKSSLSEASLKRFFNDMIEIYSGDLSFLEPTSL